MIGTSKVVVFKSINKEIEKASTQKSVKKTMNKNDFFVVPIYIELMPVSNGTKLVTK